jgi:threonine dehydratase
MTQPVSARSRPARLSVAHIAEASAAIDPVFLNTPQFEATFLGAQLDCRLIVKVETLNPIGSFKARGAHFLASQLPGRPHLVCATAGNFGLGMAHAAGSRGMPITVFTSTGANPIKIERLRALGADVRTSGAEQSDARQAARIFAAESGATLVEDGRAAAISEGAGTIAVELLRWREPFDFVVLPLGDGALLGGVACWVKAHSPSTQVIGVCAAGAPAMQLSWRSSRAVSSAPPRTIAEGLAVQDPFPEAVANLCDFVDDIVLVEDEVLISSVRLAHQELGVALEPSGAAGLAALLAYPGRFQRTRVATVLTGGGSLTAAQMQQFLKPSGS